MDSNKIGLIIGKLRVESGVTQQELAKEIGVKRETVNQWENGTRQIKAESIIKLCKYFNVTADYLLGLSEIKSYKADKQAACLYTGLPEPAIDTLHLWNEFYFSDRLKTLTALIREASVRVKDAEFHRAIIDLLTFYFGFSGGNKTYQITTGGSMLECKDTTSGYAVNAMKLDDKMIENAVLLEITQALTTLKECYQVREVSDNGEQE
jgi:transcriptional regulator with XRE-family HTH domain